MNKKLLLIFLSLVFPTSQAVEAVPFSAKCEEGATHRYDGGNGLNVLGVKTDYDFGWSTEKWGDLIVSWDGGKTIKLGRLDFVVLSSSNSFISAVWSGDNGSAVNIYSFIIDVPLGEAVYSQVQASTSGENRLIKVRSQDLKCAVK